MSKALLVCFRHSQSGSQLIENGDLHRKVALLNENLTPDNITPRPSRMVVNNGLCVVVFNPGDSIAMVDTSVCIGSMLEIPADWWKPEGGIPDGSYAIYRSNEKSVELLSDIVASRTIWYAQTDEIFVASSSQRAIVAFLGRFSPNRSAIAWMLSSGTLGPYNSWDQGIKLLEGDSRLQLDRETWKIEVVKNDVKFVALDLSPEEHKTRLKNALDDTFSRLGLDYSKWVLALSGGYDSRAILMMLKEKEGLRCITWGLGESLEDRKNDASIAKALAYQFNVRYEYFETDFSEGSVKNVLNRYLIAGEGRVDFLTGYMDGFKIWKTLFEANIEGILRGDEGFGWRACNTPFDVMHAIGILRLSDYSNLSGCFEHELPEQILPRGLHRREGESIASWRDRLYHECRIPLILSAMNDLKSPYVEIMNPLLSRTLIECVRTQPDKLRTDKMLFKELISASSPEIDFNTRQATDSLKNIFRNKEFTEFIIGELNSSDSKQYIPSKLDNMVKENLVALKVHARTENGPSAVRRIVPKQLRRAIRILLKRDRNYKMDVYRLAFRAFIVVKMCQMLEKDAKMFLTTGRAESH